MATSGIGDTQQRVRAVVGEKAARALAKAFGIETVEDLLRHYPRRYVNRGELTDLSRLRVDETVTVLARVLSVTSRRMRQRRGYVVEAVVTDGRAELVLTFFAKGTYHERVLEVGRSGLFAGKVARNRYADARSGRSLQLVHPEYQMLGVESADEVGGAAELDELDTVGAFAGALIPIYPATAALRSWDVARCVRLALPYADEVSDVLPASVRERRELLGLGAALRGVHTPRDRVELERAQQRLRFDEAFVVQAELVRRRSELAQSRAVPRPARGDAALADLDAALPFTLTPSQQRVGAEIAAELDRDRPMHRLLQGDVGSGKTVVALRAMLGVVDAGGQAVLLAPTEVLAHQHHRTLSAMLGPLAAGGMLGGSPHATRVGLLTGSMSAAATRASLLDLASGDAGIVVGTHALLEDRVQFRDLGLVVIDEQHRFGVDQRAALTAKGADGTRPHVLVMTATPIPRTVAMTVFGDLDVSTLTDAPSGRAGTVTHIVPARLRPELLDRTWARVREEITAGHRVYVVCPRIGAEDPPWSPESARAGADDPEDRGAGAQGVAAWLQEGPLAGVDVGLLHGRMSAEDKDAAMTRFETGQTPCLVATTVVEVGVDVGTASTMVVMDADRFGISQLHQLRGRIGRAEVPGVCLLVTFVDPEHDARSRLEAVAATTDGFSLARTDLDLRREGDVLGVAQSGRRTSLRLLSVLRDADDIVAAREQAELVLAEDPGFQGHPNLVAALARLAEDEQADYVERA